MSRRQQGGRDSRRSPGGGPLSATTFSADFTAATLGAMANATFAAAYGLAFARASAATVQTGAATVDSTPTTDVPRIGSVGAAWGRGLVLEESRTNLITNSRAAHLAATAGSLVSYTNAAFTGPDGTPTIADRVQVTSGGFSNYATVGTVSGVGSEWVVQGSAGTTYDLNVFNAGNSATGGSATASWQRVSIFTVNATGFVPADGRANVIAAGNRDNGIDFMQFEAGNFATEAIVTAGASATRAGEHLSKASSASLVDAGRVGMYAKVIPKGALSGSAAAAYLWYVDASNYARIETTGNVTVTIGGTTQALSSSPVTWSAQDTIELWVEAGGGSLSTIAKYRANGGAATTIGTTTPLGSVSPGGGMDLLCSGTSGQLTSWVQQIVFYKSGQRPVGF